MNFAQAEIRSLGRAIPARRITNKEWEDLTGAAPEWIISNTGIETRARIGAEESTVDLGLKAAREALGDFDAAALDFVLVATNSQPYLFPSTASLLQKELGAVRATSMDLQAGCTGWLYGLRLATSLIESGQAQSVLVVGT
ncbi:MAG: 3-oxoacyl-ACP synthase, partial [Leptospiraceae bacterium]|nr:3-oxoacyl-ACP synthase [Leptospiraceae bacterium]